ncbi:MAG: DUF6427 family protein [Bacteroidales bacterium]|nr:DUF6427 family protein [Bacteroidales bacterium]
MLLRIFKGTRPLVISLIIITVGAVWISAFLNPQNPGSFQYETSPMPLYGLVKSIIGDGALPGVIFSFLLFSLLIYLLVNFNTTLFFINERTFLPAVIYVLISGLFPQNQLLNPVLPAAIFLMLAIIRIMGAYRKPGTAFNFFDAGLLISIGSFFYCNLIWFALLLFAGIALLRTINFNEIALSFLGIITPYVITTGLYYVIGKDIGALFTDVKINLFGESSGYYFSRLTIVVLIFCGLMILVSLAYLITRINIQKIKSRKTFYLLLWAFSISLALYIILPSVSVEMVWITGIAASYILAHYFVFVKKKLLPEIIFTVFFMLILLVQLLYIL